MQKKQNSIILWRIIFTYLIAFYHFDNSYVLTSYLGIRNAWYIAVEFFFIVSGYLLYNNLDGLAVTCKKGISYFAKRYRKIYPFYLGSFLLCFVLYVYVTGERVIDILVTHVFELFCMQGIGLNVGWVYLNDTAWYISVMLIAGFIIYHCLVKWKDTFIHFAAPIIVMISYSYIYRYRCSLDAVLETEGLFLNQALMRGLAGMCLGIFAVELSRWLQKKQLDTLPVRLAGVCGFLFVIVCAVKYGRSEMDFLFAAVLTVSVAIAFLPSKAKLFGYKWLQNWSDLTLCIYLIHYPFSEYVFAGILGVPLEFRDRLLYLGGYLVVITLFADIFKIIVLQSQRLIMVVFTKGYRIVSDKEQALDKVS